SWVSTSWLRLFLSDLNMEGGRRAILYLLIFLTVGPPSIGAGLYCWLLPFGVNPNPFINDGCGNSDAGVGPHDRAKKHGEGKIMDHFTAPQKKRQNHDENGE